MRNVHVNIYFWKDCNQNLIFHRFGLVFSFIVIFELLSRFIDQVKDSTSHH